MAGVYKQKGKLDWYALWKVGRRNVRKSTHVRIVQAGKTERQTRKEASDVADRLEALAKGETTLEKQIDALRAIQAASGKAAKVPSVAEYLTGFAAGGGSRNKSNSNCAFRKFLQWMGSDAMKRLDRVSKEECQAFIDKQAERVRSNTVKRYKTSIAAAFNAAVDQGILSKSPWKGCKIPRDRGNVVNLREAFTVAEVGLMLEKLPSEWRDMVLVCLGTGGQRMGDCACLRWESVDFAAGVIRLVAGKSGVVIENPLVEPLAGRLRSLWNDREEGSAFVFPLMARRYSRSQGSLSTEFIALLRGLGIAGDLKGSTEGDRRRVTSKSFHGLRRFAVTSLRDSGASADMSRAIVGHESEEVERTYYRASMESKAKALAGMMQGLCIPVSNAKGIASA